MKRESTFSVWPGRLSRLLEKAWANGVATRPTLEPEMIIAAAVRREGVEPAAGRWRARFETLCDALEGQARLTALGRTIAHGQLVRIVASRVRAERWVEQDATIAARRLAPPVVLVGQMRSGTTRAHRLLACDPHFVHTRLFETLEPVPYRRSVDRRPASAFAAMSLVKLCNPDLSAIHPTSPFAPEEEFGLHSFSLWGAQFEAQWTVPAFVDQCEAAAIEEVRDVYAEFKMLLQLRGACRGLDPARPMLLKAPQFCTDIAALLHRFPDARIIRLRRPPEALVGSGASLVYHQMRVQSDQADRLAIGREWLRKTAFREDRLNTALAAVGADHLTLDYGEVTDDWRGAMARVYAFIGRPLTNDVSARMARFTMASTAHRGHHYALEDFGLDERSVRAALV